MNATTIAPEPVAVEPPAESASTDIERFLEILHPDGCYEIRIPKCPSKKGGSFKQTASGYFVDHHAAKKQIEFFAKREPAGIYASLNTVDSSLLGRSCNAIKPDAANTSTDADIVERRWVLIDIDPRRAAGTSASDAENKAAIKAAAGIRHWLAGRGWPEPLRAMSGNGATLLYRVSLPNDEQAKELVSSFLRVIGDRFNSERVDIDHSVYNASRILKVAGTVARKGSNLVGVDGVDDRPHRQSFFIDTARVIEVVDRALIEAVVAEFTERKADAPETVRPTASHVSSVSSSAIIERCRKCMAIVDPAIAGQNGSARALEAGAVVERFELSFNDGLPLMHEYNARCVPPWDERDLERKLSEGMTKARDAGETGRMLRDDRQATSPPPVTTKTAPEYCAIAPGTRVQAGDRGNVGEVVSDDGDVATVRFTNPKNGNVREKQLPKSELRALDGTPLASTDEPPRTFAGVDALELSQYVDAETDWLVDGIFAADQPTVFGAASKATKTTQLVDLSVAMATTTPWLGHFPVTKRRKVLFITGESNYRAASKRIKRALDVRGFTWSDIAEYLRVEAMEFPSLPSPSDRAAIARDVKEHGIEVVIIDPLYRGLQGLDLFKMNEVGDSIIQFVRACQPASVIISHHVVKTAAREMGQPTLEDLSGAGLAESAGNWWLIGRNVPYAFDRMHDLSVVYGGRDEQAGLQRLVFNEAEWTAEITSGHDLQEQRARDAKNRKQEAKEQKLNEVKASVRHALANEREPKPRSWIEERSGHPQTITRSAIAELLNDLTIVQRPYVDSINRERDGLILATMAKKEDC